MTSCRVLIVCVVSVWMASWAHAESQREEVERRSLTAAVSRLMVGDRLTVKESSGTVWHGRFESFDFASASLILSDAVAADGTVAEGQLELRESSVEYVMLEKTSGRYRGALIGLGIGVAAAALASQGCCGNPDYGPETMFLVLGPLFGGAGALVGYVVDEGSTTREMLYTAKPPRSSFRWQVTPFVTGRSKGVVLLLSF